MDFYTAQDQARRNTRWLVLLFIIAVVVLIAITNVLVAALLYFADLGGLTLADSESMHNYFTSPEWGFSAFNWQRFGYICLAVISTIFLVVLFKWAQLSAGGKAVAERLGGQRIPPHTDDRDQRRCLNVVEEMALAAGTPVPPVYLLAGERGINAFAAGVSPSDAVIGITQGSLSSFNREQLQGVIGHEFSHILNGDMRINIRLAALLKGITFIGDVGEVLVRGGSRRGRSYSRSEKIPGQILAIGLALWVLGWLGGLFAGFIKAAVSRQREHLADASAVQFTRNPRSVADALKVIGGYVPSSTIAEARANELSHIFFGQIAGHLWQVLRTHPPLDERIRRIQPDWNGEYLKQDRKKQYQSTPQDQARLPEDRLPEETRKAAAITTAAVVAGAVLGGGAAAAIREAADADFADLGPTPASGIPEHLVEQARDPFGANAISCGLLLSSDTEVREAQFQLLLDTGIRGLATSVRQLAPELEQLAVQWRLPLLELSLPALKCMSAPQYRVFKEALLQLARADQRVDLYEWCMYQLVRHYLDPEFIQVKPSQPRHRKPVHVRQEFRTVVSVLAWHGHRNEDDRNRAFTRGVESVGLYNLALRALAECDVAEFSKAVSKLADCYPLLKPRMLKGMAQCAAHDGVLTPREVEILVAVAAVMDCPVPASVRAESVLA